MRRLSLIMAIVCIMCILLEGIPIYADDSDIIEGTISVSSDISNHEVSNIKDIQYLYSSVDKDGKTTYTYSAVIDSAPTYIDNKPIDCSWYEDNGQYISGLNLFSAIVSGTSIDITANGKTSSWNPTVLIDSKEYHVINSIATVKNDIINENYRNNVLEWDYGICVRRVRVIEGLIQESYIFEKDPQGTVWIKSNYTEDIGFNYDITPYAYDSAGNNLPINEYKQVSAKDMANAKYPVTIDPTDTFVTSAGDGYTAKAQYGWSYAQVHDYASASTVDTSGNSLYFGQKVSAGEYTVYRAFVYFDTSSIPDSANITSSILSLYGSDDQSVTDFNMTVQSGMPTYPSEPLVAGDYNKAYYSGDGGSISTVAFSTSGYNNISLNTTGCSWVSVTGTTKLALRSAEDIASSSPILNEYVGVYSYEKGAGYRPTLYVTYTSTTAPTVTTNAASNLAKTAARINGYLDSDGGAACTVWFKYALWNGSAWGTNTSTSNQSGFTTGQSFYADLTGLSNGSTYRCMAFADNGFGTANGSWVNFSTYAVGYNPSNVSCTSGSTDVFLQWVKNQSSEVYIRYKIGSYPTGSTDGNIVANQSGSSFDHTGLLSGTSYYYRLWGMDAGVLSTNYSQCMCTTTAGYNGSTSATPLPTVNMSGWHDTPNGSILENNPLYPLGNTIAAARGIPQSTWWLFSGFFVLIVGGIFIYTRTNRNMLVAFGAVVIFGCMMANMGIFPLWTMIIFGFWGIAFAWKELR